MEIIENEAVKAAGAVWGSRNGRVVIVVDPNLSAEEKQALIEELTGA